MQQARKTVPGLAALERSLAALKRRGRLRELKPRNGLDFASNDYLALADSPQLRAAATGAIERGVPIGSGGSRLLRGNHPEHEQLEAEAAEYFAAPRALFFAGGFFANAALFSTLPRRGDIVVHDELIHASVHDGLAATKAEARAMPHSNANAVDDALKAWRKKAAPDATAWISVESLYSMDGDRAPIDDLAQIADRHGAMLVIDEAHATGLFGPGGRGLAAHLEGRENIITLHTCGKALGVSGGLFCASPVVADALINRARAFIYATAPSPLVCAIVRAALKLVAQDDERRAALHALIEHTAATFRSAFDHTPSGSQISPVILGTDTRAVAVATQLQNEGFDVRAIRPPTVPEGTARLRIATTLNVTADDVTNLANAIAKALTDNPK